MNAGRFPRLEVRLRKYQALLILTFFFGFLPMTPRMYASGRTQTPPAPGPVSGEFVPGEVLVKFRSDAGASLRTRVLQAANLRDTGLVRAGVSLARTGRNTTVEEAVAALRKNRDVVYAEPNYIRRAIGAPGSAPISAALYAASNDPRRAEQWSIGAVNLVPAWDAWAGGDRAPVDVAVVDEGVDSTHEDLAGRVDTTRGYDFVDNDPVAAPDPANPNEKHGTHVAGIVAAAIDNGLGIAGAAGPAGVSIIPVRVLGPNGGTDWAISQGVRWAADQGAEIINLSLGGFGYSQTMADAVAYAQAKGVLVVAAAGNSDADVSNFVPASLPGVLTVAAAAEVAADCKWGYDATPCPAWFSNHGLAVDVAAPGVNILSTVPGGGYEAWAGTSMATPLVAGVAALLKSIHNNWTALDLADVLTATAGNGGNWNPDLGFGVINAGAAVAAAPGANAGIRIVEPVGDGVKVSGAVALRALVGDPNAVARVAFAVDGAVVSTVDRDPNDPATYRSSADLSALDPGSHTLSARALDASGSLLAEDSVKVNVMAPVTSGLGLKVLDPNGNPAIGARVRVIHPYSNSMGGLTWDRAFSGTTNSQGLIVVPSAEVPDGETYWVLVSGTYEEPTVPGAPPKTVTYFYRREITSPADAVIDASGAVRVTVNTMVGGGPVPNGYLDVYPVDAGGGYVLGGFWRNPLYALFAQLDGSGAADLWLEKGAYAFHVSDNVTRNVWVWQTHDVTAGNTVTIDPAGTTTLTLDGTVPGAVYPGTAWAELWPLGLGADPEFVPVFDGGVDGGRVTLMPGNYQTYWGVTVRGATYDWSYDLFRWILPVAGPTTLSMGSTLGLTLSPADAATGYPVLTSHEFSDGAGNLIDGVRYFRQGSLRAAGLFARRTDRQDRAKTMVRHFRPLRAGGVQTPQYIDPWLPNGYSNPTLQLLDANGNPVSGEFSYDPWYYFSSWWSPATALSPGSYVLRVALDLAADGSPWPGDAAAGAVHADRPVIINDAAPPDLTVTLLDPGDGDRPYGGTDAYVALYRPIHDSSGQVAGYTWVADTNSWWGEMTVAPGGIVTCRTCRPQAGDVLYAGYGSADGATVAAYHELTSADAAAGAVSLGSAAESQRVAVTVNSPDLDLRDLKEELVVHGAPVDTLYLNQVTPGQNDAIWFTRGGTWNLIRRGWAADYPNYGDHLLYRTVTVDGATTQVVIDALGAVAYRHTYRSSRMLNAGGVLRYSDIGLGIPGSSWYHWFGSGLDTPSTVRVTPGAYGIVADLATDTADGSQSWYHFLRVGDAVDVDAAGSLTWGGDFQTHLALSGTSASFGPGDTVSFDASVTDAYGHSLESLDGIDWGERFITRFRADRAGAVVQAAPRRTVSAQDHLADRSPFLAVTAPDGTEVSRVKSPAHFHGRAGYTLPETAAPGVWRATLLYGVDALGPAVSSVDFLVGDAAVTGGAISGVIELQGRPRGNWGGVSVKVIGQNLSATTAADGSFSLQNVPAGTVDLLIRAPGYMAAKVVGVTVTSGRLTAVGDTRLRAGDASGDHRVNLIDLSILAWTYGMNAAQAGYDGRADFDGDNKVDLTDLALLASNYGSIPEWVNGQPE